MNRTPRVLLINPPIRLSDKPRHIPHGLAIIASRIRSRFGAAPLFLDLNAHRLSDEETRSRLKGMEFDIVFIGGLIPVYKRIIHYAEMIKSLKPRARIVAGGSAAMSVPEMLLTHAPVDAVCAGEGEEAALELLEALSRGTWEDAAAVKGFYFKTGTGIRFSGERSLIEDLDRNSALPAYDLLPMEIYLANPIIGFGRDIDFISSRGCPFGCTFCYQPWGRKFRGHSVDYILEALAFLRENYRIDFVSFQDDEFMADPRRVERFCERVQSRVPGLLWSCTGRVNIVTDRIAEKMRRAGCVSISYGFESGSPRMLREMKKNVTVEQMEEAARINRRHGMMLPVSFIIGMPGENEESCRETVEFCVRNRILLKSMMFATPYPGTELFAFAVKTGRIPQEGIHDFVMRLEDARDFTVNLTDAFTDAELIRKREEMIAEVCSRVQAPTPQESERKLRELFGPLADTAFADPALMKHRAQHGGIDLF